MTELFHVHYRMDGIEHLLFMRRVPNKGEYITLVDENGAKMRYQVGQVSTTVFHPSQPGPLETYRLTLASA